MNRTEEFHPSSWEHTLQAGVPLFIVAVLGFALFYHPIIGSNALSAFFYDDFYYYLVIAKNIVGSGVSTFDGTTVTNGYHPLWMVVVSMLVWVTGGTDTGFFVAFSVVLLSLTLVFFRLLWRLRGLLFPQSPFSGAALLVVMWYSPRYFLGGMEVALALPVAFWLLILLARQPSFEQITPRNAAMLGFVASLLVLSRLDAVFLVMLLVAGWAFASGSTLKKKAQQLGWFFCGGILLGLYLLWNLLQYGAFMPVSGQAKQMMRAPGFSLRPPSGIHTEEVLVGLGLLSLSALAYFLWKESRQRSNTVRTAVVTMLLFPLLSALVYGVTSDWILFPWYLYTVPILLFAGLHVLSKPLALWLPVARWRSISGITTLAVAVVVVAAVAHSVAGLTFNWKVRPFDKLNHATQIAAFVREHPGKYAMGDRAGLVTWMIEQPVLQLEGLVEDRAFLEHIRREESLNSVLDSYDVDYLIASVYEPFEQVNGAWRVVTPHPLQAGDRSLRMEGLFPDDPVFTFEAGICYTWIFAVSPEARSRE